MRLSYLLPLALALLASVACTGFEARPDAKTSTLTLPGDTVTCVRGHQARQTGAVGAYGTPVVEVSTDRCEAP